MAPTPLNICLCIIRWAPVLFITAVVAWSYYAYVIQMCLFTVDSIPEKVIYLILYHPLIGIFLWAYWQTIFTDVGTVPKEFYLSRQDAERYMREENEDVQREILARHGRNCPVQCRTANGDYRFCEKCKCIKPDRAHHCSVCGACVLKMDHHCPWVNNCVNFTNYKFFVLFLGYALVYCVYVAATSLQYFIKFWSGIGESKGLGNMHLLFLFFASAMFGISVSILFGYHLFLSFSNRSTLESFRAPIFRTGPDKDGFSLGRYGNFIEIFGEDKRYWFLPIFTSSGDGIQYPTRVVPQEGNSYQSMERNINSPITTDPENPPQPPLPPQPQSFGDGINYPIRTVDEDYDSLLGQRQRWMEDADETGPGYDNHMMSSARM